MVLENTFARDDGVKSFASHLFETAQQSSNFTNIPPLGRGSFLHYCIFIRIPIPSPNRQPVIPVNKHSHVRYGKRIRNDSYLSPSSPYNSSFNLIVTKRVLEIDEWKIPKKRNSKKCERKEIQRISGYSKPPMAENFYPSPPFYWNPSGEDISRANNALSTRGLSRLGNFLIRERRSKIPPPA